MKKTIEGAFAGVIAVLSVLNYVFIPFAAIFLDLGFWLTFLIIVVSGIVDIIGTGFGFKISTLVIMPIAFSIVHSHDKVGAYEIVFYIVFAVWAILTAIQIGEFIVRLLGDRKKKNG